MLLSSGVIWRHRDFERLPRGVPRRRRGAAAAAVRAARRATSTGSSRSARAPCERETGNPATVGAALRHAGADADAARGGRRRRAARRAARASFPTARPVVLATGGFQADRELVRRARHAARPTRCSCARRRGARGDGLRLGLAAGCARRAPGSTSSTAATCPRRPRGVGERDFVAARPALRAPRDRAQRARRELRAAHLVGDRRRAVDRAPARRARLVRGAATDALGERVRERTVGDMVERRRGGRRAGRAARRARSWSRSWPAITTTLGGLRIDAARAGGAGRLRLRAPTPAGSRPAATRAGSRPRSCSGGSPRTRLWGF